MLIEGRDVTLYLPLTNSEGKPMNFSLERQGRWVTLTLDTFDGSASLWGLVEEEVSDVSFKFGKDLVKLHGPTEKALWAVWLFNHQAKKLASLAGYQFDEAEVDRNLAELIRDIKKARGVP